MPENLPALYRRMLLLTAVMLLVTPTAGCLSLMANLINAGWGNKVPAKFTGLEEKRVGVVCVSRSSLFGPSSAARTIASRVHYRLGQQIPTALIIDPQVVDDWVDRNGWDEVDFRVVGAGIDSQLLIAIDIISFSLHEGNTLYKGRADVEITVYDMDAGGKIVFNEVMPQIQFPVISGQHITDTTEAEFRKRFIAVVAEQISQNFYDYDRINDFGRDTAMVDL